MWWRYVAPPVGIVPAQELDLGVEVVANQGLGQGFQGLGRDGFPAVPVEAMFDRLRMVSVIGRHRSGQIVDLWSLM